ncbi:MAG: alpha/beta hydrolase [Spirochaetes bacterium]|nr:alpha/beta hydrolase [Spirochaetota bacterium]
MTKLLFVHGAGGTGAVWHYQRERFPGCDAVTLPGRPDGALESSIDGYRDWLRGYCAAQGYGPVLLAGQSMGGGIALSYALAFPGEVRGLILIATGARLRVNPAFLALLAENADADPSWYRDVALPMYSGVEPSVRDRILDLQCSLPVRVHLNDFLCCDRFDVMDRVSEIRIPTLIVSGDADVMTPLKYSRYLAERIHGSRLAVIPGGGHLVFLQKPEEVNREIDLFLSGLAD